MASQRLLALDAEMLSLMALELGRGEAVTFAATAERMRAQIRDELWDEERRIFANRLRSGCFVRSVGPTSFYPMIAGAATPRETLPTPATPEFPDRSSCRGGEAI